MWHFMKLTSRTKSVWLSCAIYGKSQQKRNSAINAEASTDLCASLWPCKVLYMGCRNKEANNVHKMEYIFLP